MMVYTNESKDTDIEAGSPDNKGGFANTDRVSELLGRFVILCLIGVAVWFLFEAPQEDLGSLQTPGPGLWPLIAATGTIFVGLVALIFGSKWQHDGTRKSYYGPLMLASTFLATYMLLVFANGLVAVTFSSFMLTRFVGRAAWWKALLVAVSVAVGIYLIFNFLLGVPPIR